MLYKGSTKIKDVYFGSTKIKEIYKGSTLLYSSSGGGGYPSGTVLFESATAGTHTLQVDFDCTIHLDLVGGGGGGMTVTRGGEGAYISGNMSLSAGSYTIIVGAKGNSDSNGGDSSFENNIAGGGKSNGNGGTATVVKAGLTGQNGASQSTNGWINGYGAGGRARKAGTNGYCKIEVV